MENRTRRAILIGGALGCVAIVLLAYFVLLKGDGPAEPAPVADAGPPATAQEVASDFVDAWSRGDHTAAGALTDQPSSAGALLAATAEGIAAERFDVALSGPVAESGDTAKAKAALVWALSGDRTWRYSVDVVLVRADGEWAVRWASTTVHPKMAPGLSLALRASAEVTVVDRDGKPLVRAGAALPATGLLGPGMARVAAARDSDGEAVVLVDGAGAVKAELVAAPDGAQEPYRSTMDIETMAAAQAAVDGVDRPAYLVAIHAPSGGILAVAENGGTTGNGALGGLYPPGSTFKVVTATAALSAGAAGPDTVLPCPGQATFGTRTIRNDDFALGDVALRTAFARSCNTTFAGLAEGLPGNALVDAAASFGFAADFEIPGITTHTGKVLAADGTPQQVENAIGQGTVQSSPFGLALMAATVARGGAVTPALYDNLKTRVNQGYDAPSAATIGALRGMMRGVVTSGTATALGRHGAVAGKTGTAQFGDGTGAHGWFAGYRGDIAFAVLVEEAGSSKPAVDVVGRFLGGI